jgi:hypothetical protein
MFRQWPTPGSRHVSHFLTPENGSRIRVRAADGGDSTGWETDSKQVEGAWLRLVRSRDRFTAAVKRNNVWVPVGSSTTSMWPHGYVGFFVCSANGNATSEVTFSNVSISGPRDTDGDGLLDTVEWDGVTSAEDRDSDDDGFDDGTEIMLGTQATNPADNPLSHVSGTDLINSTTRNGGFEWLGGVPSTAKATHWDSDPDGDVDFWTHWGTAVSGPSTASNDSGTEIAATATSGSRIAFLQPGNATFNETTHLIAADDFFVFTWDWVRAGRGSATVQLAYRDGPQIVAIQETGCTSTSDGVVRTYGGGWVAPAGHPAIGKPLVITVRSGSNYPEVDSIRLLVQTLRDLDGDGMDDEWETLHGLSVGTNDGLLDADHDGTENITEFRLGLPPDDGRFRFAITTSDSNPSDGFTFSWPSKPGLFFTVSRSINMLDWTEITRMKATESESATTFTDPTQPPPERKFFYRVELNL